MIDFVNASRVELIKQNASDIDVARAAWVSNFGEDAREKDGARIEGLIKFLYNNRHMSPFEHGSFTFFIDTPIFVAREFMRHRTMSFNEVSGRYTTLNNRFYVPPAERPLIQTGKVGAYVFESGSNEQYALARTHLERHAEDAWKRYEAMMQNGIAREVARNVLPVNTMTQFYATVNPRNLMQFLGLRDDRHALWEIREVAVQMDAIFKDAMPLTHKAYRAGREESNSLEVWQSLYESQKAENDLLRARLQEQYVNPVYNVTINQNSDGSVAKKVTDAIKRNEDRRHGKK